MNVIEIPFVKKVGITQSHKGKLELSFTKETHNHLATMHASAQFTLAETASGDFLQISFPELVGKVIPVLRDAQVKFKKPAIKNITAYPSISTESHEKFNAQFSKKGRASISVNVDIKDVEGTVTCVATYNWFIQKIET